MYESYYRFAKPPFRLVADPSMLFVSESARESLSRLEYAIRDGKGIVVMTGEVGTGKTTLVNRFLDQRRADLRTAYIFNPTLSGLQLLRAVLEELGLDARADTEVELTQRLYQDLLQQRRAGRRTVLFVDEAQALLPESLEELRLLTNLETRHEKLLHIVLVGQPELLDTLESHALRPLRQRIELFIEVGPLGRDETSQYIAHRLRLANPMRPVRFTGDANQWVHRISAGVPRNVNKVCDAALLLAFVEEASTVTSKHVREAVRTIDGHEVSLRLHRLGPLGRWHRFAAGTAAVAAAVALFVAADTTGRRSSPVTAAPATPTLAGMVANANASEPAPTEMVLVHLASFRERAQAEAFARSVVPSPGRRFYLQHADARGTRWVRVLVGDFATAQEAGDFARTALAQRRLAYAQPVRLSPAGLESWEAR